MSERGFTLLEAVVALTIVLILVLPLAHIYTFQVKREATLKDRQTALELAKEGMEEALASRVGPLDLRDDSSDVELSGTKWKVMTDVIDGRGEGEPALGTDPLEVRVKVYQPGKKDPLAELVALKRAF
jgi:prepilin-type N-terminal cleavage/methylation domain-containing protein